MESKEYYKSLIAVIEYIADNHLQITCEEGDRLSGNYWPRIFHFLIENKIGTGSEGGDFYVTQGQFLNPIYADCFHALEKISQEESDRELDNAAKAYGIKHAKRAFAVSVVAIILSAISIIWQILGSIL